MNLTPRYDRDGITLFAGDALAILPEIEAGSVDAVIADPPYPEIDRPYGRLTEPEWHALMRSVVSECRRILKPSGSAVFILQPNYNRIGETRLWLWEFMVWAGREWNLIEDAYWWNYSAIPNAGSERYNGLMRRSIKTCVWLGARDCYRNQDEVLWSESDRNVATRLERRLARQSFPSGNGMDRHKCAHVALERGGVTPFNLIPITNANSTDSAGSEGHGAGTPEPLCDWWVRYISPPGSLILDPFMGSGTTGLAALRRGRSFIGIEKEAEYVEIARRRLDGPPTPLFPDSAERRLREAETPLFSGLVG